MTIDGLLALVQRVKLVWGIPGQGVDASAANPLPVGDVAAETALASILAKLGTTLTVNQAAAADQASTLTDGRKVVVAAGTPVAIVSSSTPCKWVTLTALLTNTRQVNVGGSDVLATVGSDKGTPLNAGDSATIPVANANAAFVDAQVNGEGVSFTVGA